MLGVDVGQMIAGGALLTIPMLIVVVPYCMWIGKKIYQVVNEDDEYVRPSKDGDVETGINGSFGPVPESGRPARFLDFRSADCGSTLPDPLKDRYLTLLASIRQLLIIRPWLYLGVLSWR